ncbi:MAG: ATP-binding protein [Thiohalomonadales bacterium]
MKSFKTRNPKVVIITTLVTFMLLMMLGSATAIYFLSNSTASLKEIVAEDLEQQYVFNMQKAASRRILYLYRMVNTDDIFERDDIYIQFLHQGDLFLKSSTKLQELFISGSELIMWDELQPKMIFLKQLQQRIINIALNEEDNISEAKQVLFLEAVPAQDDLLKQLSKLLEYTREEINEEFYETTEESESAIIIIISFALVTILLSILISYWVLRHFLEYERIINIEKNKAITANEKKSQFLANMSHEIRTPLTAIIGYSQIIKKSFSDKNTFEIITNKITRNGKHLLDLINDVLDLSKIEAGELQIERITISPFTIIDEVITIVSEQAERKGLLFETSLQYPLPSTIETDPVRLKQILINLCSNAIKFTEKGSVIINVSFDHLQQKLYFEVTDTGIGLSSNKLNKVFLPFNQADMSTTRKFGGTGLGLHISKRLAIKLNGALTCSSIAGIGSKFQLELQFDNIANDLLVYEKPAEIKSDDKVSDITEFAPPKLSGKILLAEDNEDNRDLISMYIDDTNAELTVVENGIFAVQECLQKEKQFDLILMDMQMPLMDGFEATRKLRSNGYTKPIVILSANALKIDIDRSIKIGADAHLAKPIELEKFYNVLATYLNQDSS